MIEIVWMWWLAIWASVMVGVVTYPTAYFLLRLRDEWQIWRAEQDAAGRHLAR